MIYFGLIIEPRQMFRHTGGVRVFNGKIFKSNSDTLMH